MNPPGDCREPMQAELLARPAAAAAQADPLRPVLASLLCGRVLGQGVLNATLGLTTTDFEALCQSYFPGAALTLRSGPGQDQGEFDDLLQLLLEHRAGAADSERWLACAVAYACSGRDHLWQDLGLANRSELSLLMNTAFPRLAALNVGDMKWKKFIYRFYCSREGIYVCPAPSCGECSDYSQCFAKEE
jgi:nitrogen fixation protein NifQ